MDSLLGVADGVGGVEAGDLRLGWGLGEGFFELGLLRARVAVGFGGLSGEGFGGELERRRVSAVEGGDMREV